MKKIIFIYLSGTLLPLFLFLIEKNLPYNLLQKLTILSQDIKLSDYSGVLETIFIIIFGATIILLNLKNKKYLYNIYLDSRSIIFLALYSIYRIINASYFFFIFGKYSREQIQIVENISRDGLKGIIISLLNSIFPVITTLIISSYFSLEKKCNKLIRYITLIIIFNLGISSLLFDITRGSRGNITLFTVSIVIAYLFTYKKIERKHSFKNKFIKFIFLLSIISILLGNTYYRTLKSPLSINRGFKNSSEEKYNLFKVFHDSTIAKAVGGQIITNQGITGRLNLTSKISNPYQLRSDIDNNLIQSRDSYCKKFDCLHIFKPIKKFISFFGYSKEEKNIYIAFSDNFPFNSSSHLGEVYIIFNKSIAPIFYFLLLYINASFIRSQNKILQFISLVNLSYFSFLAFTTNWFLTFYPYITYTFSILFFNMIGIKIKNCNK